MDLNNILFENKKVTIILDDKNEPWFKAKNIAEILEYSNIKKAIQQHINEKYKKNFHQLCGTNNGSHENLNNQEKEIYINEAGLYELIFSSKMTIALTFRYWVFEEVLPSIRKQGEYKLNQELKNLKEKNSFLSEKVQTLSDNIQSLSVNNKTLKNFVDNVKTKNKSGYIYIATSKNYSIQNNFKIGKTDNLKNRLSGYNTNRTCNDRFYYCFFERVYNSNKIESIIMDLLEDFKDKKGKEIINLHYKYLLELVQLVIKNINEPYEYLNKLIKNKLSSMYDLKPIIPKELNIDNIEVIELRNKIIKLLDECIENNNLNLTRKELIEKLDLNDSNKILLWNNVKRLLKWVNSKTPILYKNKQLMITY